MRISGAHFAEADGICDYIPGLSTVSNLMDLFLKCVVKCLSEKTAKNRYWTHIKHKNLSRCCISLVPVLGNIYAVVKDYFQYKKDKIDRVATIAFHQKTQRRQAGTLAIIASRSSGIAVTEEQMMPASTEYQQGLYLACFLNDLRAVHQLLVKGITPNFFHFGTTPLVAACQQSGVEIVRLLLQHGAEVNTRDRLGNTPFSAACASGNLGIVEILHPYIRDINEANAKGVTPLMLAASSGNQDLVSFLIKNRANLRQATKNISIDAVTCAIFVKDHASILPLLFGVDEDIDTRSYQFQLPEWRSHPIQNLTPFLYASLVGAVKSAMYLITRSDVRRSDSYNHTALYYSAKHIDLVRAILLRCSTPEFVNQQNRIGCTALHQAIEEEQGETALLLLQSGANPLLTNSVGKTPLILACEKGLEDVVKYIKQHNKIDAETNERMVAATKVAKDAKNKAPSEKGEDLISSGCSLMKTGLDGLRSIVKDRFKEAELGPTPRSGFEMFLGRHL